MCHDFKGYNDIKGTCPATLFDTKVNYLTKHGTLCFLYRVYSIAVERVLLGGQPNHPATMFSQ